MTTAVLCLGRTGDVINALGIAKHLHDAGQTPDFIVNAQFAAVLLGVSYVNPVKVHFQPQDIARALKWAEARYDKVLLGQTFGKGWAGSREHPYNLTAWLNCGMTAEQFNTLPLVFDRRDLDRENHLYQRHVNNKGKPLLLMSVACARSAPFASHAIFTQAIERKWGDYFDIVNLCKVKAARIYDVLGIMDRATLLITADTAFLHLAAASQVPVVALVSDKPFCATAPRCRAILTLPGGRVIAEMKQVHAAVASTLEKRKAA